MSASSSGAVKAFLEQQRLGVAVYRDAARADTKLPYVTVRERISYVQEPSGDFGDADGQVCVREQLQLDVWQPYRDEHGRVVEDYGLVDSLTRLLRGCQLPTHPKRVYGVQVDSAVRVVAADTRNSGTATYSARDEYDQANVVRDVITITLRRDS